MQYFQVLLRWLWNNFQVLQQKETFYNNSTVTEISLCDGHHVHKAQSSVQCEWSSAQYLHYVE